MRTLGWPGSSGHRTETGFALSGDTWDILKEYLSFCVYECTTLPHACKSDIYVYQGGKIPWISRFVRFLVFMLYFGDIKGSYRLRKSIYTIVNAVYTKTDASPDFHLMCSHTYICKDSRYYQICSRNGSFPGAVVGRGQWVWPLPPLAVGLHTAVPALWPSRT